MQPDSRAIAILALIVATGCSTIEVRVDLADPKVVEREVGRLLQRRSLPLAILQAKDDQQVRALVDVARERHRRRFLAERVPSADDALTPRQRHAGEAIAAAFEREVAPFYFQHERALQQLNGEIALRFDQREACLRAKRKHELLPEKQRKLVLPPDNCNEGPESEEYLVRLLLLRESSIRAMDEFSRGGPAVSASSLQQAASLIGSDGLLRSEVAHAVTHATDELWVTDFDRSKAVARLGDTNVAIKMETRGNFTIKGLSFDPSEVARVASKVMTQSLLAFSSIAGVPVSSRDDRTGYGAITRQLQTIEQQESEFRADASTMDDALLGVATLVVHDLPALKDQARRKAAIEALAELWNAQRSLVLVGSEPASGATALTFSNVPSALAPGASWPNATVIGFSDEPVTRVQLRSDPPASLVPDPSVVDIQNTAHHANFTLTAGARCGPMQLIAEATDHSPGQKTVTVEYPVSVPAAMQLAAGESKPLVIAMNSSASADVEFAVAPTEGDVVSVSGTVATIVTGKTSVETVVRGEKPGSTLVTFTHDCGQQARTTITVVPAELSLTINPGGTSAEQRLTLGAPTGGPDVVIDLTVVGAPPGVTVTPTRVTFSQAVSSQEIVVARAAGPSQQVAVSATPTTNEARPITVAVTFPAVE